MSAPEMTRRIPETSPRRMGRYVGAYYLLTILTGAFVLFFHHPSALAADLVAPVFYLTSTVLLYSLSKRTSLRKE